jgi:DNA polymerase III subunit gamma/tau
LGEVTEALTAQDSRCMLDLVMELERNGRNLQHFCRELARYFRNLLVAKVAGANTRLIGASPQEQERLAQIAAGFSEEDLTRYLQLTLDLFQDLQASLQPRLHLEVGLLRLVQAGKLLPIEEAIAGLGSGGGSAPAKPSPAKKPVPPAAEPLPQSGPWKDRLHSALLELGMQFTADAVEHSQIIESNGELQFTTPDEFKLALNEKDILKVVQKVAGRPMRVKVTAGTVDVVETPKAKPPEDEASERALSHPEVRRFQETFPDAQVRVVRNLKE